MSLCTHYADHSQPILSSNCPDIVRVALLKCLLIIIRLAPDVHNLDLFSQSFSPELFSKNTAVLR